MESLPFIGIDYSALIGRHEALEAHGTVTVPKKPDLSYWVGGKYITDAQGNQRFRIEYIYSIDDRKRVIIGL